MKKIVQLSTGSVLYICLFVWSLTFKLLNHIFIPPQGVWSRPEARISSVLGNWKVRRRQKDWHPLEVELGEISQNKLYWIRNLLRNVLNWISLSIQSSSTCSCCRRHGSKIRWGFVIMQNFLPPLGEEDKIRDWPSNRFRFGLKCLPALQFMGSPFLQRKKQVRNFE